MKKTAIAFPIFLAGVSFVSCQNNPQQNKNEQHPLTTTDLPESVRNHFIPVDSANKMIQSYLNSIANRDSANTQLQSLVMNADALREYLKDTSIKEVKVMFAHTLNYINSGNNGQYAGYKANALTIIFAGYNSGGNYVLAPGNMVPDDTKPCPPSCPVTGTASNPLITN